MIAFLAQNSSVCGSRLIIQSGGCGRCKGLTEISALSVWKVSPWNENGCVVAERCAQIIDEFQRRRFALPVVEAEGAEIIRIDAGHEAELHAAAEHLIDDRDFFGEPQRMIERHDIAHRPERSRLVRAPAPTA